MITSSVPVRVIDGKISRVQEIELRIANLEAILTELKMDLEVIRVDVKEEELKKVEKLNKYQKVIDSMLNSQAG